MNRRYRSEEDRIKLNVSISDSGCWEWQRKVNRGGYGSLTVSGRSRTAHRHSYETFVGAVPDGLELDHLCRNRKCVNPQHLEPVTRAENVLRSPLRFRPGRGGGADKSCCKHGHDLADAYRKPDGRRFCRPCQLQQQRDYRARQRLARAA